MKSFLKFMRKIFMIIGAIVLSPIAYWAVAYVLLLIIGFHPDAIGIDLASKLAASGKSVRECKQIIHPISHFLAPSSREQRSNCIHRYAKLTKDPTACDLLMPSSYGMSCLGVAESHQLPCNTGVKEYSVFWRDGEKENLEHVRECLTSSNKRTELGNQCCSIAQVAFIKGQDDCSPLKDSPLVYDRCWYALAWKLKDESYCSRISNENARAACTVQTKAIREEPSFCPGCVAPVSLEEAKKLP